jgi:hypothetical protein
VEARQFLSNLYLHIRNQSNLSQGAQLKKYFNFKQHYIFQKHEIVNNLLVQNKFQLQKLQLQKLHCCCMQYHAQHYKRYFDVHAISSTRFGAMEERIGYHKLQQLKLLLLGQHTHLLG